MAFTAFNINDFSMVYDDLSMINWGIRMIGPGPQTVNVGFHKCTPEDYGQFNLFYSE